MPLRLVVGAALLAGLAVLSNEVFDQPLSLGPGFAAMDWVVDENGVGLIALLFGIRLSATVITLASGGVGGVFIPLVVGGALVGRGVGEVLHPERFTLYTLLGIAAFLGAGYRVPLAAVMFVAETTGRPNFIVPALFAAVAAELVMGEQSITAYQRRPRQL